MSLLRRRLSEELKEPVSARGSSAFIAEFVRKGPARGRLRAVVDPTTTAWLACNVYLPKCFWTSWWEKALEENKLLSGLGGEFQATHVPTDSIASVNPSQPSSLAARHPLCGFASSGLIQCVVSTKNSVPAYGRTRGLQLSPVSCSSNSRELRFSGVSGFSWSSISSKTYPLVLCTKPVSRLRENNAPVTVPSPAATPHQPSACQRDGCCWPKARDKVTEMQLLMFYS